MILAEVKNGIIEIKAILKQLVQDEEITVDEAQALGPVILTAFLRGEYIELD